MYIFSYSKFWSDIITVQLLSKGKLTNELIGYGCIITGRYFDDVLKNHYEMIDSYTGEFLHMFSFYPPPKSFAQKMLSELEKTEGNLDFEQGKSVIRHLLNNEYPKIERSAMINEKVNLLKDLSAAGLPANHYADFIFFEILELQNENYINVMAVKSTNITESSVIDEKLDLFRDMGKAADMCFKNKLSITEFISKVEFKWNKALVIKKTLRLHKFIKGLIK